MPSLAHAPFSDAANALGNRNKRQVSAAFWETWTCAQRRFLQTPSSAVDRHAFGNCVAFGTHCGRARCPAGEICAIAITRGAGSANAGQLIRTSIGTAGHCSDRSGSAALYRERSDPTQDDHRSDKAGRDHRPLVDGHAGSTGDQRRRISIRHLEHVEAVMV
jgi:hypothetical protein